MIRLVRRAFYRDHTKPLFKCDPPREKVPPRGFIQIIYDVI